MSPRRPCITRPPTVGPGRSEGVYGLRFALFALMIFAGVIGGAEAHGEGNPSRSILIAQNTSPAAPDTSAGKDPSFIPVADSLRSAPGGVLPKTALYHSMTLPGWGQLDNGKKKKAALLIAAELAFVGGAIYEQFRLGDDDLSRFEREQFRTDRNTFIIYWLGTRIYGLVDAYVDAHLARFNTRDIAPAGFTRPVNGERTDPDSSAPEK